jgi:putative hydrolase of the HAD superfamily
LTTSDIDLKAITFDLWETLLFEKEGSNTVRTASRCQNVAKALNQLGITVSIDQVSLALKKTINSLLRLWDDNKDVSHSDQLRYVVKFASNGKARLKKDWILRLSSAYISPIFEVPPYVNPDAFNVIKWLKNRNKKIGIICNTGVTPGFAIRKLLTEQEIAEYFDQMIFSDEEGIRKPDPRIFRLTAGKLKTKPDQIAHIGDNLKADVHGAKTAGFKAIYLASKEGHDKTAQSDPTSLAFRSRNLGKITTRQLQPDKTISTLAMAIKAIEELEA